MEGIRILKQNIHPCRQGISEVEEVDELQAAAGRRATELCVVCISPAVGAK